MKKYITVVILASLSWVPITHAGLLLTGQDSPELPEMGMAEESTQLLGMSSGDAPAMSEQCLAFAKDPDADLGEVLKAGCEPTLAQMSALMDNPLGNVAMWMNQYDSYHLKNDATGKEAIQGNYMGILQFPTSVNEDWNLINRVIYNVASAPLSQRKVDNLTNNPPGTPPGHINPGSQPAPLDLVKGRTTDFGDMYYVGLFSKKEPTYLDNGAKFVWGLGFDVGLPTAQEDVLGTGKWTVGPSALAVYLGEKWKGGALLTNYWDFAGDSDRDDVRLSNLQYLYYYSLDETTSIGAGPNIIIDWEQDGSDRFTVPVGLGINKTVNFGKLPIRFGFEAMYSAHRPDR
ncbi:MAG: hypothetical protein EP297_10605 [Gammaproteobacteria bacterium]|nr:MAG: hypothetical protein EP297_10605 [Gammaproteobacteria bacterium]